MRSGFEFTAQAGDRIIGRSGTMSGPGDSGKVMNGHIS